ncbi:50S ribosomal protein L33 [Candidatus Roizmanbacteria bacterium]|nr:50S ribosomal protein L33 [Candidatus Roizmanbacteria bacterium]
MPKKGSRMLVGLVCEVCNRQNYVTEKNRLTAQSALRLKKYCGRCKKHTTHKEKKKLG